MVRDGLIPARAGRTDSQTWTKRAEGAHPRSRGADWTKPAGAARVSGSSPLARGGLPPSGRSLAAAGLIPARAGRTSLSPCRSRPQGAHPRSRGADLTSARYLRGEIGSSPLARGGQFLTCNDTGHQSGPTSLSVGSPPLGCLAPAAGSRIGAARGCGSAHQLQPVEVHRLPVGPMNAEGETLLSPRGLDHHSPTIPAQLDHSVPEFIAHATRQRSHEDTRRNLEEPSGDVSP